MLIAELALCLKDPDPQVRDGYPYVVLRTWIERDVIAGERRASLGDEMAARFTDPQTEARTFAPLVLDMIVSRGDFRQTWLDAFTAWYPAELDLRGYDEKLGWLHAVAHGADLLGAFGRHPGVEPAAMLDLAAARMLTPTGYLYAEREDDRLARAIALTLTRPELTPDRSVCWLDAIGADLRAVASGTTPVYVSNALRTLRMLYLLADRGVPAQASGTRRPLAHADAVKQRLVEVLESDAKSIG
ncbi:DUF2785 domain-containing protein [Micromonospora sp. WMMA1363]|uniref:DUF2785 domain-containing protein n=1 Tax=Micromonospora sp. WMMA1363 TaxID=3053985 RepID=UPI00259C7F2D|nr:DUF2785 domain-containing protein [Micromonospora sp. WMMA1363]MDM4719179.1 DUF2785 domain-containing protein [Micromonospora sp. WMMA1363]